MASCHQTIYLKLPILRTPLPPHHCSKRQQPHTGTQAPRCIAAVTAVNAEHASAGLCPQVRALLRNLPTTKLLLPTVASHGARQLRGILHLLQYTTLPKYISLTCGHHEVPHRHKTCNPIQIHPAASESNTHRLSTLNWSTIQCWQTTSYNHPSGGGQAPGCATSGVSARGSTTSLWPHRGRTTYTGLPVTFPASRDQPIPLHWISSTLDTWPSKFRPVPGKTCRCCPTATCCVRQLAE